MRRPPEGERRPRERGRRSPERGRRPPERRRRPPASGRRPPARVPSVGRGTPTAGNGAPAGKVRSCRVAREGQADALSVRSGPTPAPYKGASGWCVLACACQRMARHWGGRTLQIPAVA
eukprot:gene25094-biopygen22467